MDEEGAAGEDGEPDVLHVLHHHEPHRHRLLSPPDAFRPQNHALSRGGFYPVYNQDFPNDSAFLKFCLHFDLKPRTISWFYPVYITVHPRFPQG